MKTLVVSLSLAIMTLTSVSLMGYEYTNIKDNSKDLERRMEQTRQRQIRDESRYDQRRDKQRRDDQQRIDRLRQEQRRNSRG